jgi:hypothetical protein
VTPLDWTSPRSSFLNYFFKGSFGVRLSPLIIPRLFAFSVTVVLAFLLLGQRAEGFNHPVDQQDIAGTVPRDRAKIKQCKKAHVAPHVAGKT